MPEVGIVMTLNEKVSSALKTIAGNAKALDKDLDELEDALVSLSKQKAPLSAALKEAQKELAAATKQFNETKDEASGLRFELAQAQRAAAKTMDSVHFGAP